MHAAVSLHRVGMRAATVTAGAARVVLLARSSNATQSTPATCWGVARAATHVARREFSVCAAPVVTVCGVPSMRGHSATVTEGTRYHTPRRGMRSGRKPWLEDRANRPEYSRAELDHVLGGNISSTVCIPFRFFRRGTCNHTNLL